MEFYKMRFGNLKIGLIDFIKFLDSKFDIKNMSILEIGSWTGESACLFAAYFKKVYCVDRWDGMGLPDCLRAYDPEDVYDEFKANIASYNNIHHIKKDSAEASEFFSNNGLDFVYIDGDHSYEACRDDIASWFSKAKYGIAGHDYMNGFKGVEQAVNEKFKKVKTFIDSSWLFLKGDYK